MSTYVCYFRKVLTDYDGRRLTQHLYFFYRGPSDSLTRADCVWIVPGTYEDDGT